MAPLDTWPTRRRSTASAAGEIWTSASCDTCWSTTRNDGILTAHATGSTIAHLPQQQFRRLPAPASAAGRAAAHRRHPRRPSLAAGSGHPSTGKASTAALSCQAGVSRPAMAAAEADPQVRVVRIADIARVGSGATPLKARSDYYLDGTIPWVTSGDLSNSMVREPKQYITEVALRETAVRIWPPGTLLVAMYGEGRTRGRVAELTFEATTNRACAAIVLHDQSEVLRRGSRSHWSPITGTSGGRLRRCPAEPQPRIGESHQDSGTA